MEKILVIGNKPYHNLTMNTLIDEFENNCRCNLIIVSPQYNTGTKFSKLALCNHAMEVLHITPLDRQEFIKFYNEDAYPVDIKYLGEFWDFFQENKHKYSEIFHSPISSASKWNQMLASYGCPHRITKVPRSGMSVIFENLAKQKKVFVINFSLYDTVRIGWGGTYPDDYDENQTCHSKDDEINILFWLHNHGYVDATLCMLEDTEVPTLKCENIQPTAEGISLLQKIYGKIEIKE
tara:strand:- start:185 stop:892 length:708 start_codon:yes stop_codon:yes gene_type:complete